MTLGQRKGTIEPCAAWGKWLTKPGLCGKLRRIQDQPLPLPTPPLEGFLLVKLRSFGDGAMQYPSWLPVPQAWLRAVLVFLSLVPCLVLWRTFAPILEIPGRLVARRSPLALDLAGDILFYWFLVLGMLAPVVINALIDHWVWHRPHPKQRFCRWCPGLICWAEGIYSWSGFLLCFVVVAVVDMVLTDDWRGLDLEDRIGALMGVVFILDAYWFELRHRFVIKVVALWGRWGRGRGGAMGSQPVKPIDPVEAELDEMRRNLRRKD